MTDTKFPKKEMINSQLHMCNINTKLLFQKQNMFQE